MVGGLLAFTFLAVPPLLRAFPPDLHRTREAIDDSRGMAPIGEPAWREAVEVPFGTVDLPGTSREASVATGFFPGAEATIVGSGSDAVAVAEISYAEGYDDPDARAGTQAGIAYALGDAIGVDLAAFEAYRGRYGPVSLDSTEGSRYQYDGALVPETVRDGLRLRLRVVSEGDRDVLVLRVLPDGKEDQVTDRVVRSVRIA